MPFGFAQKIYGMTGFNPDEETAATAWDRWTDQEREAVVILGMAMVIFAAVEPRVACSRLGHSGGDDAIDIETLAIGDVNALMTWARASYQPPSVTFDVKFCGGQAVSRQIL